MVVSNTSSLFEMADRASTSVASRILPKHIRKSVYGLSESVKCLKYTEASSSLRIPKWRVHSKTRFSHDGKAICKLCSKSFCITHQGYRDIERHLSSTLHRN